MSDLFRFDELTWPEVSALPRTTPLVLPLGGGFNLDQVPALLASQGPVGILPVIPFGWAGSGLEVPSLIFTCLVRNLVGNLLEDGFISVHLVLPHEMDMEPGLPVLVLPQATPDLQQVPADTEKVLILPIGHTEQHGYHAPLSTDTLIIQAIGSGTAAAVPEQAACLPVFPYGVSTHRRSFPGTFNIGGRAFEDFWLAVVDSLVARGFTRFYLMSGHGGNSSFLVNVVKYAGEKYPQIFCATAFLYLSGPHGVAALEGKRRSARGGMGHACELET
ncbi:MAG TPA: creatininase family protein, partial [Anaerolineales bacterium]